MRHVSHEIARLRVAAAQYAEDNRGSRLAAHDDLLAVIEPLQLGRGPLSQERVTAAQRVVSERRLTSINWQSFPILAQIINVLSCTRVTPEDVLKACTLSRSAA